MSDIEKSTTQYEESINGQGRPAHSEEKLHRALNERQIQMLAMGGAIGTGLVIGSGTAIVRGGPAGALIGFAWMGLICFSVLSSLGEMAAFLPIQKGFVGYASRFVDEALGFALGWNYLFKYWIVTPNNITAASIVVQWWTESVPVAVWISMFLAFILVINMWGVSAFGTMEYYFSLTKVIFLTVIILAGLIIDWGGNPNHVYIGTRYWRDPGAFSHYIYEGKFGAFLGFWSVFSQAMFAYIGTELVGVTIGEAKNPRKSVPKAIRRTFYRILFFYIGGVFVVGLLVPSNDGHLIGATKQSNSAAASPFTVAFSLVGLPKFSHFINSIVLVCTLSAANSDLYIASRTLYAIASEGKAPRIFAWTDRRGVPVFSVLMGFGFACLAYLNVASSSQAVFEYFVSLVTMFGALTWMTISFSHIRFMKGLEHHGFSRDRLPYKAPFMPYSAYISVGFVGLITITKGFNVFIPTFEYKSFTTTYMGLPIYILFFCVYKYWNKSEWIPIEQIDLVSDRREFDEEDEIHRVRESEKLETRSWFGKAWRMVA